MPVEVIIDGALVEAPGPETTVSAVLGATNIDSPTHGLRREGGEALSGNVRLRPGESLESYPLTRADGGRA